METHSREGVVKEEKFPNTRKPSHQGVCGEFWNLRGEHNWEGKNTHTHTHTHTQIMHLTLTPSGEVAQMLASTSSEWGLNMEVQITLLRVRTGLECPADKLRELT